MKYKSVLIAGGAGFLGSYLCDYYVEQGARVVCIDNLSSGQIRNIKHLQGRQNFTFVKGDIVKSLPKSVTGQKFDLIINMASPASPPHYQRLALETLQVGSIGTEHLLQLAERDKARFFQASTSEVYGDPEIHPQPESYKGSVNCYGPRSMYDESKRYAESLIYVYHNNFGVDTVIARFFNTYGPRMDANDGRVVSNFSVQAINGKSLTVYGKGDQTRSFCYVDDLIQGIVKLIDSKESGPMNLGNPKEFTVLELAELVKEITGNKKPLTYMPLPGDDPMQRKPVIDYANHALGWQPKIPLEQGLSKTIKYFENSKE
jgi:nucleoside-diphosphate-sugar epimerase